MGIETVLGAVASPIIRSLVGGAIGGSGGGGGNQTTTTKNEIDPRMAELLYGKDNQGGLLNRYVELLNKGQSPGMSIFGNSADNYIGRNAGYDMGEARDSAFRLMKTPLMRQVRKRRKVDILVKCRRHKHSQAVQGLI